MNEADVSSKLRTTLVEGGAVCWKICDRFHASRPDLLLLYKGVTGYFETKVHPGKLTPLQVLTLTDLASHGAPTWLGVYHKTTKHFEVTDIATGIVTTFKNHKELALWLCARLSSSTKQNSLN